MRADDPSFESGPQTLDGLLARYLTAVEAGEQLDRQQLIAEHPELAEQLRAFFRNHDEMRGMAAPPAEPADPQRISERRSAASEQLTTPLISRSRKAHESAIGRIGSFGDYELIEEIEKGGMGVVYRARQISLDRLVALKLIKSGQLAGPQEIRRFRIEAEAAANLHHPGIVPVYEVGEIEGLHYYTMQFIVGQSLATRLESGPLPPVEAAQLVAKIARAVSYAHSHGVIHRDLKPANILLDAEGEPKITDFGLAKRLRHDGGLTATGQILGTPAYMAPEQAAGRDRKVSEATDIYALGALFYAALTGRAPHVASSEIDLLLKVLDSDPIPPSRINPNVSQSLDRVCLCCLEKDPQRRYPSADAVADDLQRYLRDEPLEVPSRGLLQPLRRWGRREPALVTHLAAVLSFLIDVVNRLLLGGRRTLLLPEAFQRAVVLAGSFRPAAEDAQSTALGQPRAVPLGEYRRRATDTDSLHGASTARSTADRLSGADRGLRHAGSHASGLVYHGHFDPGLSVVDCDTGRGVHEAALLRLLHHGVGGDRLSGSGTGQTDPCADAILRRHAGVAALHQRLTVEK